MKTLLAIVFALIAICLFIGGVGGGLYVALYQGWFKGIMGIVDFVRAEAAPSTDLAWAICRIVFASVGGAITAWVLWFFGFACFGIAKGFGDSPTSASRSVYGLRSNRRR